MACNKTVLQYEKTVGSVRKSCWSVEILFWSVNRAKATSAHVMAYLETRHGYTNMLVIKLLLEQSTATITRKYANIPALTKDDWQQWLTSRKREPSMQNVYSTYAHRHVRVEVPRNLYAQRSRFPHGSTTANAEST